MRFKKIEGRAERQYKIALYNSLENMCHLDEKDNIVNVSFVAIDTESRGSPPEFDRWRVTFSEEEISELISSLETFQKEAAARRGARLQREARLKEEIAKATERQKQAK